MEQKSPLGYRAIGFLIRTIFFGWKVIWAAGGPEATGGLDSAGPAADAIGPEATSRLDSAAATVAGSVSAAVGPDTTGGSVFVCNHAGPVGPIVMTGWFKPGSRPWMIDQMLSLKTMPGYLCSDFFHAQNALGRAFFRALAHLIAPLALAVIKATRPISAHNGPNALLTVNESVMSLIAGQDNVIFPEDPTVQPLDDACTELQTGFLHIARVYARKTGGEVLPFYPVAVCVGDRTIRVGARLGFDPARPFAEQKQAMAERLRAEITQLMASARPPCGASGQPAGPGQAI